MQHSPLWAGEAVAAFLREQAAWREAQAQRFPGDPRNLRSASMLAQLAAVVEELTEEEHALRELVALGAFDDQRRFLPNEEARRAAARYGFDRMSTPGALLQELVAATRRPRRTPAQERDSQMTTATRSKTPT